MTPSDFAVEIDRDGSDYYIAIDYDGDPRFDQFWRFRYSTRTGTVVENTPRAGWGGPPVMINCHDAPAIVARHLVLVVMARLAHTLNPRRKRTRR